MRELIRSLELALAIKQSIIENDGELLPDVEQSLASLDLTLPVHVDQFQGAIEDLGNFAEHLRKKAAAFAKAAKSAEAAVDRLKTSAQLRMELGDLAEIEGNDVVLYLKNGPPAVHVLSEDLIPDEFFATKRELSKTAVKKALQEGEEVPGARLVSNKHLATKLQRGKSKDGKKSI